MDFRRFYLAASLVATAFVPAACMTGTGDPGTIAAPGATPFVSLVTLNGLDPARSVQYHYSIQAKTGATARPVSVTYSASALATRGYLGSTQVTVPVFGLYAGRTNHVSIEIVFKDGTTERRAIDITTPAYVDPDGVYDHLNILKSAVPAGGLGYSYLFLKSIFAGPIVVDTDGEVRWVSPVRTSAFSATFRNGAFLVGTPSTPVPSPAVATLAIERQDLDGTVTRVDLPPAGFTEFHHNIGPGKTGLLAGVDAVKAGVFDIESDLTELSTRGEIVSEWDMADLLSRHMLANGDDPTAFVRPGIDWFHLNSAVYDPSDDSVIVSSRENFLVKIDYVTGAVKWVLGDPTKYWYSFPSLRAKALQLEPGGLYPIGQHAVSITPDGLVMVFNNGLGGLNPPPGQSPGESRLFSAVSAYRIDPVAMTAREEWRFDYGQSIFSQVCSSAYEEPNGSLLVDFATADNNTKARLIGLDASHNVVFDFEYPSPTPCGTAWNAEPLPLDSLAIQ